MQHPQPTTFAAVSAAAVALPDSAEVALPGGRTVHVQRLNWIEFTQIWQELSALLSQPESEPAGPAADSGGISAMLAAAPVLAGQLVKLCTPLSADELSKLPYDEVLTLAAAAVRLNFVDSAGLRDFFAACTAAFSPPHGGSGHA